MRKIPVAAIHTHFSIFRNVHEAHEGDVTLTEQVKAMERFIRWHERQVKVGRELLAKLRKLEPKIEDEAHHDASPAAPADVVTQSPSLDPGC